MQILPIAASGLSAASAAAAVRADNIVNVATPQFTAAEPVYSPTVNGGVAVFAQETGRPTSLVIDMIGLKSALNQYAAAAALVTRSDDMHKALLDSVA